jgi:hypothetical protein
MASEAPAALLTIPGYIVIGCCFISGLSAGLVEGVGVGEGKLWLQTEQRRAAPL